MILPLMLQWIGHEACVCLVSSSLFLVSLEYRLLLSSWSDMILWFFSPSEWWYSNYSLNLQRVVWVDQMVEMGYRSMFQPLSHQLNNSFSWSNGRNIAISIVYSYQHQYLMYSSICKRVRWILMIFVVVDIYEDMQKSQMNIDLDDLYGCWHMSICKRVRYIIIVLVCDGEITKDIINISGYAKE